VSFIDRLIFTRQKKRIFKAIRHSHVIRELDPEKSICELKRAEDLVRSNLQKNGISKRNWEYYGDYFLWTLNIDEAQSIVEQAVQNRYPSTSDFEQELESIKQQSASFRDEVRQARNHLFGEEVSTDGCDVVVALPNYIVQKRRLSDSPVYPSHLRTIYREIFAALRRNNVDYRVCSRSVEHGRPSLGKNTKYISFRSEDASRQGLHICTTEKKYFYSFDRKGYAGWSEFAEIDRDTLLSIAPDQATADAFFDREVQEIIENNVSKYSQPDGNQDVHPDKPYIFIALQTINDCVQQLAYMPMLDMLDEVCTAARQAGVAVVAKRHPLCTSDQVESALNRLSARGDLMVSKGSIHDLISSSVAVCTVNSSVGAEALLHLKPVYLFGKAAYQGACFTVEEKGKFSRIFKPNHLPQDEAFIRKFFYVFRNDYELDITSEEFGGRLEQRILQLLED